MGSDLGNKEIMAKNIQYYMNLHEKSRNDICEALGIKYTTFTDWVNGNSYPRIDKIELMANYFGIRKSDLVEDHEQAKSNKTLEDTPPKEPEQVMILAREAKDLSHSQVEILRSMIRAFKEQEAKDELDK